jgi:hypothetical protein
MPVISRDEIYISAEHMGFQGIRIRKSPAHSIKSRMKMAPRRGGQFAFFCKPLGLGSATECRQASASAARKTVRIILSFPLIGSE